MRILQADIIILGAAHLDVYLCSHVLLLCIEQHLLEGLVKVYSQSIGYLHSPAGELQLIHLCSATIAPIASRGLKP